MRRVGQPISCVATVEAASSTKDETSSDPEAIAQERDKSERAETGEATGASQKDIGEIVHIVYRR